MLRRDRITGQLLDVGLGPEQEKKERLVFYCLCVHN